jgi:hypothetical protein
VTYLVIWKIFNRKILSSPQLLNFKKLNFFLFSQRERDFSKILQILNEYIKDFFYYLTNNYNCKYLKNLTRSLNTLRKLLS